MPWLPFLALIKRQFITGLRQIKRFVFLMLFLAGCTLLCDSVIRDVPKDYNLIAQQNQQLLMILYVSFFLCSGFLLPGIAAATLAAERQEDLFHQLRMTLLSPLEIIVANLVNCMGFFLLLVFAALPALSLVLFSPGVDTREVAGAMQSIFVCAAFSAALGTTCAVIFKTPVRSVVAAYIVGVMFWVLVYGVDVVLNFIFSPFRSLMMMRSASLDTIPVEDQIIYFCPAIVASMALGSYLLRRPPGTPTVRPMPIIDDPAMLEKRRKKFPYYLLDPLKRLKPIANTANPITVMEVRAAVTGRATAAVRLFYCSAIISYVVGFVIAFPGLLFASSNVSAAIIVTALQILLVVFGAIILAGNIFVKEHDRHNLDMLRMTMMTPRQIVTGKFIGSLFAVVPLILGVFVSSFPVQYLNFRGAYFLAVTLSAFLTVLICVWLAICLTVYASTFAKRLSVLFSTASLLSLFLLIIPALPTLVFMRYPYRFRAAYDVPNCVLELFELSPPLGFYGAIRFLEETNRPLEWIQIYFPAGFLLYFVIGELLIALSIRKYQRIVFREK